MPFLIRLCLFSLALLLAGPGAHAQGGATDQWTERLLSQIGGRDVWARARGFHMVEILRSDAYSLPAIREYWVDFEQPRMREKTLTNGVDQIQALDGRAGWRLRDGRLEPWTDTVVSRWRSFWPGIPTRIFHLLAARDPRVQLRAVRPDRMDIHVEGRFALWLATSENGTPLAYGREDHHLQTHFLGRMRQYGPVRLWDAAYEPGGAWGVQMIDYRLLDRLPEPSLFSASVNGPGQQRSEERR